MKRLLRMNKKARVLALSFALVLAGGGAAFAYFTTTGTGSGVAQVGAASTVSITQLPASGQTLYSSVLSPLPPSMVSMSYEANGISDYGNQVSLASPGQTLSSVLVDMAVWTCGNWAAQNAAALANTTVPACATTPGTTFNEPITMTIYNVGANNSVGSAIATDTQTFAIPFRPSANATCATPSMWKDGSGNCHNGMATSITFNSFGAPVLPSNVIYDISYSTGPNPNGGNGPNGNAAASLNVAVTTEPAQPTVGTDPLTGTGDQYIAITPANGGGYYPNYCDGGAGGHNAFRFDPCASPPATQYIPAVQFNATANGLISLFPGGPAQPIDFRITNNGTSPAFVQGVTFALTGGLTGSCSASWFNLIQPTNPVNVTIPVGGHIDYQPSGASLSLINEPFSQNDCQNDVPVLTFTSN